VKATGVTNVRAPIYLAALHSGWPIASVDGIICINMIHISLWEATVGLIKGAGAIPPTASPPYLYGPYIREGFATAESNQAFDRSFAIATQPGGCEISKRLLRWRNPRFSGPVITECPQTISAWCSVECDRVRGGRPARALAFRDRPVLAAGLVDLNCACCSRLSDPTSPAAQCWFRPMLFEPVAFPTLRRRICLAAVELLADRSGSPRPESDAAPSALEIG
jgi:hypothetical protein